MGKKRIVRKHGSTVNKGLRARAISRVAKRKVDRGTLHIQATYNNTIVTLTDKQGNALMSSSSGSLGFKGAKKSTPFASAKVGELVAEKALQMGMLDADVVISGVGPGRESAMRAFTAKGISLSAIRDVTPVPFNGPRAKKPRRV
ncbi:MAG: 30S ribosomal protein S11 [Candidatus Pacebacteria bacterium]|nr:30S ribosomal protein S11 [Candidatus Paceibacterota bacterium]